MIHILSYLIDIIFPPSPSLVILRQTKGQSILECAEPGYFYNTITLSRYQNPIIKSAITAGKFEHNQTALHRLSPLLTDFFSRHTEFTDQNTCLIAIPIHHSRLLQRGYNQVHEIMRYAYFANGQPLKNIPLLRRSTQNKTQSHLNKLERNTNVNQIFTYHSQSVNWNDIATVIIIDDVVTTGATVAAARAALAPQLPSHVQIIALALAH